MYPLDLPISRGHLRTLTLTTFDTYHPSHIYPWYLPLSLSLRSTFWYTSQNTHPLSYLPSYPFPSAQLFWTITHPWVIIPHSFIRLLAAVHLHSTVNEHLNSTDECMWQERRQRLIVTTELTELRSLRETDIQTLRSQHVQELSQVKIDHVTTMEQERARYELLVSTLRAQIETIQNTMHSTREQMEQQITELSLDRSQLDFQVKELTRQMNTLQSDRSRMTEGDPPWLVCLYIPCD